MSGDQHAGSTSPEGLPESEQQRLKHIAEFRSMHPHLSAEPDYSSPGSFADEENQQDNDACRSHAATAPLVRKQPDPRRRSRGSSEPLIPYSVNNFVCGLEPVLQCSKV